MITTKNIIDIKRIKYEFKNKFPESTLNSIFENTPDELSPEEFLTMVKLWLRMLDKK